MSVSTLELREESLELWDYSVADKLVYFCDVAIHETEERSRFIGWPAEYKLGRAWLEVHFELVSDGNAQFQAIVKVNPLHSLRREVVGGDAGVDREFGGTNRQRGMFVEVANQVELPEGVLDEPISSIIGLKRLKGDCCNRHTHRESPSWCRSLSAFGPWSTR